MADKRIQDLTAATSVETSDRFVLEQSGQAKSLTGQILLNNLATYLDGHGGISDISYTDPASGSLTGTLTITLADETVETFTVTNGKGIAAVTKTAAVPPSLTDTYTITFNDGSTPFVFTVDNGKTIDSIEKTDTQGLTDEYTISYNDDTSSVFYVTNGEKGDTGDAWYVHIKWSATEPTQDSDMVNYPAAFIGIYSGVSETAPTTYSDYTWYEYKGEKGDTGTGITGVVLDSSSGLVDTYLVSFDDGTSTTFNVTNGSEIDNIAKTSSSGLIDTYTVTLTNGLQTSFQVVNGKSIVSISWTSTTSPTNVPHVPGATDTYTIAYNDGDTSTFQIYNGLDGEGASLTVDGIPSVNGDVPLLTIDTEHGAPTAQTVGSTKSRYFDALNSVLYICLGYDENSGYLWRGAGVTVDSAMSTTSTNPVQNRIITNKIGLAALNTTAQDLSGAVNEILGDISGFAGNIAEEYDATATYDVNDLCLHNDTLYRCNTAISTAEAWNSLHWTQTTIDDEKVAKAGDTMTGNLEMANGNLVIVNTDINPASAPSAVKNIDAVRIVDSSGTGIVTLNATQTLANQIGMELGAVRTVNGLPYSNKMRLFVGQNGQPTVWFEDAGAWRTALSAVHKTGDTMSGALKIADDTTTEDGGFLRKRNTYSLTNLPSSTNYSYGITFFDADDTNVGFLRSAIGTNGAVNVYLAARSPKSGSVKTNGVNLQTNADGSSTVTLSSPSAWRKALELNYVVNDTFSVTNCTLPGYITASTRTVYLVVTTEKSLEDISTVTVQTLTGRIRGINGYVDGASSDADWTSGYTVSASKYSNNQIEIRISKSSALSSATNNTPVVASMTVGLKFT